ncbi:lipopolysaccharide biosynthesis protein [uncultured Methanolobus sp.]|uniref:lipopolysaccharide biosynthesis protein n=1 Tax=uncultured Methanolobus sp. TaxID=218300 RepID=UPI002AABC507|nr:lipopolysaccharide biosynthesis protein [uncultured Methanolobus sp.]
MTLKEKFLNGVFWLTLSKLSLKLINFVVTIVLARLLIPEDFGLVSLALIFVNFFEITRDFGLESALIHYEGDDSEQHEVYSTAFIIYPLFALFLYAISYYMSPWIAYFFENNSFESVLRALLLTVVIWSFGALPRTILVKSLCFRKMFIPQILPKLIYGLTAIALAYLGYGVWSLIIGRLILEITTVIAYWYSVSWRPSINFSLNKAIELLSFGKFVALSGVITFILSSIDSALIGKLFDAESLGYYTISMSAAGMFTIQAALVLSQIIYPIYSKLQHDIDRLNHSHLKVLSFFSLFIIPASIGLLLISDSFIGVIYGNKWLPSVPILQVLCIYGMFASFKKINTSVFLAMGNPEIMTKVDYFQLLILIILIYPLTTGFGIYGAGIAVTIAVALATIYSLKKSNDILNISMYETITSMHVSLIGTFLMSIGIVFFQKLNYFSSPEVKLLFITFIGMLIYALFVIVVHRNYLRHLLSQRRKTNIFN